MTDGRPDTFAFSAALARLLTQQDLCGHLLDFVAKNR